MRVSYISHIADSFHVLYVHMGQMKVGYFWNNPCPLYWLFLSLLLQSCSIGFYAKVRPVEYVDANSGYMGM